LSFFTNDKIQVLIFSKISLIRNKELMDDKPERFKQYSMDIVPCTL